MSCTRTCVLATIRVMTKSKVMWMFSCGVALAAGLASVEAAVVTVAASDFGRFQQGTFSPKVLQVRTSSTPRQSNIEFSTGTLTAAELAGVTQVELNIDVGSSFTSTASVDIFGYAGDGTVTAADDSANFVLVGTLPPPSNATSYSIPLDAAAISTLAGGVGGAVGLRLEGGGAGVSFASDTEPSLSFTIEVPEPAALGVLGLPTLLLRRQRGAVA